MAIISLGRKSGEAADLASFDETASAWVVAAGDYQFLVGEASGQTEPAEAIKATLYTN